MSASDLQCRRYVISGRVQGVWFRASTKEKARALDLHGWVRNTLTGEVEALACGTAANMERFTKWLWIGPSGANVTNVVAEEMTLAESEVQGVKLDVPFAIRYSDAD